MATNSDRDVLVVASKVKEYVKSKDMMSSGELPEALSAQVYALIDRAAERAKANGRQTIKPQDV